MAKSSHSEYRCSEKQYGQFAQASALPVFLFFLSGLLFATVAQAQGLKTGEWTKTNFDKISVDPDEIMSGGPPRDGIPPIDNPKFVSLSAASEWLNDKEPVIAFEHNGVARAYPLQILMFHEIVNDTVGEKPFSVTFCPLCNASIVFEREVNGEVLDFGTTGRLRMSDLIMYDRQTESWWQQFNGTGIIGDYVDTRLTKVPSQIVSFETFKDAFPEGDVLSQDTGFARQYGRNPYRGYDDINASPFLFRGKVDSRLPPMERILSIPEGKSHHLVPLTELADTAMVELELDGVPVAVFAPGTATSALDDASIADSRAVPVAAAFIARHDGMKLDFSRLEGSNSRLVDAQTGSQWNALGHAVEGKLKGARLEQIDSGVHFAFAWLAFDPDATVFTK